MKGQILAVSLVMACGLTMMIMARSLIKSLETTRQEYYESHHFADVFAQLKRAPNWIAARASQMPGIACAQSGISMQVTLDLPGVNEPASGNVRSLPDVGRPELNRLFLRRGEWLAPYSRGEVLAGEAFAEANRLNPGDSIFMLLNGKRQRFRIRGIVLSPEFIFESRPGAALPDNRTYGIFWMPYKELASAFDMDGAFNSMAVRLTSERYEKQVISEIDTLLEPYGGRGAFGRADHPSHIRVSDEIRVLGVISIGFPTVFLSVAAFMINAVLSRLLALQREQIAILKAFGFTNHQVAAHYLKYAIVIVVIGAVAGTMGGVLLGGKLVHMYRLFFRFPDLAFRLNQNAMLAAFMVSTAAAIAGVYGAVRRATLIPPAEAMRPEPPASYRAAMVERIGIGRYLSHTFRIAVRNLERKPLQSFFTVAGLALATAILIVPNCFRDGVRQILDFQWDVVERQDVSIGLVDPGSYKARYALEKLPGVTSLEPFRNAAVRIRLGHRSRQVIIHGLIPNSEHSRIIDPLYHRIALPGSGLVVSSKLGEVLEARVGDNVQVEFLEGKRLKRTVRLVAFAEDFSGITAYMDMQELNRQLGEGEVITGASFTLDDKHRAAFLAALKQVPKVSWVAVKESLRESFRSTTAQSINLLQSIYLLFAIAVAFGVVYNNARISLAEQARELATLRVIGFTQREVAAVLVTELVILAIIAVPAGLLMGTGFADAIVGSVNTETVRLPLVITSKNYAFATLIVTIASGISILLVLRKLNHLDLVSVLKAPE